MTGKKATREQFAAYVAFLENCETLRYGKGDANKKNEAFFDLVKILNSVGGPKKDLAEWKKTINEWKYNSRKKRREKKKLSEEEAKLIRLIGEAVASGMPETIELGIPLIAHEDRDEDLQQEMAAAKTALGLEVETGEQVPDPVADKPAVAEEWENLEEEGNLASQHKKTKKNRGKQDNMVALFEKHISVTNDGFMALAAGLNGIAAGLHAIADKLNN